MNNEKETIQKETEEGKRQLEDLDEQIADDLALLLRVGLAGQGCQEPCFRIRPDHLDPHVLGEGGHHLVTFTEAQQAVVHEHAGQPVTDRPVHQHRRHRGVDPPGERTDDLAPGAHLLADRLRRLLDEGRGVPAL